MPKQKTCQISTARKHGGSNPPTTNNGVAFVRPPEQTAVEHDFYDETITISRQKLSEKIREFTEEMRITNNGTAFVANEFFDWVIRNQ